MASIVNSRDLKLQATTPRFTPIRPQGIYLVESSDNFIVSEDGTAIPSDGIIYSLDIVGVTATADPVFTVVSGTATLSPVLEGTPLAANPKKAKLLFSDMLTNAVTIQASLTDTTGAVFTAEIRTIKIRESSVGVSVSTESALFRVDGAGVGSPAVMEVYVAPKFLEFASSPVYTLTAVDSSGVTIPGITLVPDAVNDMTWLLDYDEVAAAGVLSFGVKVSVTDKYSVTHTDTALLDVLVAGSSSVRVSSTSPFFVKPKTSSTLAPANIKFTAVKQGVTDNVSWSILNQVGGAVSFTTGTDSNGNATATVTNTQFGSATRITVTATAGSYSDTTTVQLVDEAVDGVFVSMANSTHEFDADAAGSIYSFTGSGSTFTIYEGATQISTYDATSPYAAGSYRFGTPSIVTDTGSISTPTFSSAGLGNYSSMSANTATVTIPVIVTKQDGTSVTINVSQTLVKKKRGAVLSLSSTASSFAYTEAGNTPAPTSATITALVSNISPTLTAWYSTITVGAGAESARTANTGSSRVYTYTPQAAYSNMPQTVTVKIYDAASGGNLIATASIGMGATRVGDPGSSAINGTLTKESYIIPSLLDGTGYTGYLSSGGGTFNVVFGTTDVTTSSIFNIVGGTDAGSSWTKVQNGLTFTINETTGVYSVSGTSWTTDSESFTVTATYSGATVTKTYTITKAKQGLPGLPGLPGKKTAVVKLFKWDTSAGVPAGDSSYNWNTNTLALGSVTGWATTVPSSTASGQKLYELSKLLIVDSDYAGTDIVDWNAGGVINEIGIRQDGSIGPTGPRGQSGYVYYTSESPTAPTPKPTATTFNFDTGAFTGLSANWATTYSVPSPTSATSGEKYWSSRYVVTEATYGGTQTIVFSDPFVHTNFDGLVTFTNLNNGTDGTGAGTTFIDGGVIKTNTVKADAILTTSLSAIESNLGTVTVADAGHMRSGKTASTDTTNAGFFLGYNAPTYAFFIGNAGDTVSLKYDGNLTMKGGTMNVGTTGAVYGGQASFDTGNGFFLGYAGSTHKFSVGSDGISGITVNISTDVFTKTAHGLTNGKIIRFSSVGGVTNMSTTYFYYVRDATADTFKVSEYSGGAALNLAGSAASPLTIARSSLAWDGSSLSMTSGVLTEAFLRTASSGARVDVGGRNDIVVWNSSGNPVGQWNTNGSGKMALYNSPGQTLKGVLYVQNDGTAEIPAAEFQTAAESAAVSMLNSSATGSALSAVSWGGKTINARNSGSSTNAAIYAENEITNGLAISAIGRTVMTSPSATNPALKVTSTGSGLAINATGSVDAANNSTTVSTVKAVNNASGGIAVEAVGRIDASGNIRVTGISAPATGQGLEFAYVGGIGYIQAYNRATSAYTGLCVSGNSVTINGSGDGSKGRLGVGTASFGTNAQNVLAIANGTAPTSSPSDVGQIYVEGGALKFRGGSGTVTVLAPA